MTKAPEWRSAVARKNRTLRIFWYFLGGAHTERTPKRTDLRYMEQSQLKRQKMKGPELSLRYYEEDTEPLNVGPKRRDEFEYWGSLLGGDWCTLLQTMRGLLTSLLEFVWSVRVTGFNESARMSFADIVMDFGICNDEVDWIGPNDPEDGCKYLINHIYGNVSIDGQQMRCTLDESLLSERLLIFSVRLFPWNATYISPIETINAWLQRAVCNTGLRVTKGGLPPYTWLRTILSEQTGFSIDKFWAMYHLNAAVTSGVTQLLHDAQSYEQGNTDIDIARGHREMMRHADVIEKCLILLSNESN